MKNRFTLLILAGLFFLSTPSEAQNFKSAIGIRLGYPVSISYKQFINESGAFEIYAGTRGFNRLLPNSYRWYSISGAYQIHKPIEGVDGLDYYFGGGASIYLWNFGFTTDSSSTSFGVQGYGGLSYTVDGAPVNLSIDWIPSLFINGFSGGFRAGYGSIAVRYIFNE